MNYEKFVELTESMRNAQKEYFKAKHGDPEKQKILVLSKKLESIVDASIKEFKNPSLFN
jgi:hypothetical protein